MDARGNPTGGWRGGGQASELAGADVLLPASAAPMVIADRGDDADTRVLTPLREAGKVAVIPPKRNRKEQREYDHHHYQARHLIENCCCTLKQFRASATRYDKTQRNFLAAIHLAATVITLN